MKKITLLLMFLGFQLGIANVFPSVIGYRKIEYPITVTPTFTVLAFLCQNSAPPVLPTTSNNGITGTWNPSTVDTSVIGTFTYTFTPDVGQDATMSNLSITVFPITSIELTSAQSTTAQVNCEGESISPITYDISPGASVSFTTNATGLTAEFVNGIYTISGTPNISAGYTITVSGMCGTITKNGYFRVLKLALFSGSENAVICRNLPMPYISYSTSAWSSEYTLTATGLPPGLVAEAQTGSSNEVRISGSPTVDGTYNYTVTVQPLDGSCSVTATGTLTVVTGSISTLTSAASTVYQTRCIGVSITPVTYSIVNSTNVSVTGLPAGVTGTFSNNSYTVSGTPTESGSFPYVITVQSPAGCNVQNTGVINVLGVATTLVLNSGSLNQNLCLGGNTTITPIVLHATNATSVQLTMGSPLLQGSYDSATGNFTLTSLPLPQGSYTFQVTATGNCSPVTQWGTITVSPNSTFIWCVEESNGLRFKWYAHPVTTGYNYFYTIDNGTPVTGFMPIVGTSSYTQQFFVPLVQGQTVSFTTSPVVTPGEPYPCYGAATSTCEFNLLGTDDLTVAKTKYYPNPVREWLNIDSPTTIQKVVIYNMLGQKLKEATAGNFSRIDFSSYEKGVYLLDIFSGNGTERLRIIKE
jgi:hypothetical protein